jgi:thioredoxin reductase
MADYDTIIIGAGPAALTAAVFTARAKLRTMLIGLPGKSQLHYAQNVGNYIGMDGMSGPEILEKGIEQIRKYGAEFLEKEVVHVVKNGEEFTVKTADSKTHSSKTVIIASGMAIRLPGIKNDQALLGKGVHTCVACLTPDSKVLTNPDAKQIHEIKLGDKVIGADGNYHECKARVEKDYAGQVVIIQSRFQPELIRLTPEHLVLAAKKLPVALGSAVQYAKMKYGNRWPEAMRAKGIVQTWIPAGNLSKGDFLFYPVLKNTEKIKTIKISDYVDCIVENGIAKTNYQTHSSVQINNEIVVSKYLLRLFGYYLAEGCATGHNLQFDFSTEETEYCNDVKNIIKKVFGLKTISRQIGSGSVTRLVCSSTLMVKLFRKLFGSGAHKKRLPNWIMILPTELQGELIKGFWRGDGCLKEKGLNFVTTAYSLATQFRIILLRLGVVASIYVVKPGKSNILAGRKIISKHVKHVKYEIEIHSRPWLLRACQILDIKHPWLKRVKSNINHAWFYGDYLVVPIKSVKLEHYSGKVYDLSIEGSHSYTTPAACVHNCDGYPYKNKKVAVIGNGNHAAEEAIELLALTKDVTVISNGKEFEISNELMKECEKGKVKFSKDKVAEFKGEKWLEGVVMKDGSTAKYDGVFLALGGVTSLTFAQKLALDTTPEGFLVIDKDGKTAIEGCYAAGGCTGGNQQIAKSAGEACNAAIAVIKRVKGLENYSDQT